MGIAWLLTLLGIGGVAAGVWVGQPRTFPHLIAAAGAGLLMGIAGFSLAPEIAEITGWGWAVVLVVTAASTVALLDWMLVHSGHSPRQGVIGPLLAVTAIHSFLDGWSVRALGGEVFTKIATPPGLAP